MIVTGYSVLSHTHTDLPCTVTLTSFDDENFYNIIYSSVGEVFLFFFLLWVWLGSWRQKPVRISAPTRTPPRWQGTVSMQTWPTARSWGSSRQSSEGTVVLPRCWSFHCRHSPRLSKESPPWLLLQVKAWAHDHFRDALWTTIVQHHSMLMRCKI